MTRNPCKVLELSWQSDTVRVRPWLPEADKILKIQRELDETKVVLHKTIDSVLARGEKLDNLVDKSTDLSLASQMFYKQAKKQNQCCAMM
jgi:synaptobrevin family protein YKT6